MEHYRALAAARPDAFRPDLAKSLGMFGTILRAAERHGEAAASFAEALRTIRSVLEAVPQAVGRLTASLLMDYLRAAQDASVDPDEELLDPILCVLVEGGFLQLPAEAETEPEPAPSPAP